MGKQLSTDLYDKVAEAFQANVKDYLFGGDQTPDMLFTNHLRGIKRVFDSTEGLDATGVYGLSEVVHFYLLNSPVCIDNKKWVAENSEKIQYIATTILEHRHSIELFTDFINSMLEKR